MKILMPTCLLLISLVFTSSLSQLTMADLAPTIAPSPIESYCETKCSGRCEKAGYKERCMKYCEICCEECKCVPSGTYGHKSECPCYRDKKTSKGHPKCP